MKKHITMLLLSVLTLSCADTKKNKLSDGNKIDQARNDAFLSAKIDGVKFYTDVPMYHSSLGIITFAAVSENKAEKIRIYINYNKGPATYTFGKGISNSDNMVYTKNKVDWLAAKIIGEGTISFKEEGDYLFGLFSFKGVNQEDDSIKQVTEGEFKVKIDS